MFWMRASRGTGGAETKCIGRPSPGSGGWSGGAGALGRGEGLLEESGCDGRGRGGASPGRWGGSSPRETSTWCSTIIAPRTCTFTSTLICTRPPCMAAPSAPHQRNCRPEILTDWQDGQPRRIALGIVTEGLGKQTEENATHHKVSTNSTTPPPPTAASATAAPPSNASPATATTPPCC